jgi:hypothetical protein
VSPVAPAASAPSFGLLDELPMADYKSPAERHTRLAAAVHLLPVSQCAHRDTNT